MNIIAQNTISFSFLVVFLCAGLIIGADDTVIKLTKLNQQLNTLQQVLTPATRKRKEFFKDIMGISEEEFLTKSPEEVDSFLHYEDGQYFIKNAETHELFQAGFFESVSIKKLRRDEKNFNKPGNGHLHVIEAVAPQGESYQRFVNIGSLQADPQNAGAVFQIASNFSALEPVGPTDIPEHGITKYVYDYTQGPFGAISATPSLLHRAYFPFYNPQKSAFEWRQTKDKQVNLLRGTGIPVVNGYVDLKGFTKYNIVVLENISVGIQKNAQVVFGNTPNLFDQEPVTHKQIIDQVYTAALDLKGVNAAVRDEPQVKQLAQDLLDAAYEGTVKSAALNGKKKVFLTLIGGGVFGNPLAWIANAIKKQLSFIEQSGLDVYVIIYDSTKPADQMPAFTKSMQEIVQKTDGTYIRYDKQFPDGKKII